MRRQTSSATRSLQVLILAVCAHVDAGIALAQVESARLRVDGMT